MSRAKILGTVGKTSDPAVGGIPDQLPRLPFGGRTAGRHQESSYLSNYLFQRREVIIKIKSGDAKSYGGGFFKNLMG